jgi:carbonic anhydrase/SulP family sulfate permease
MEEYVNEVARANVLRTVQKIVESSEAIQKLVNEGKVAVVGAIYDVVSGDLEFLSPDGTSLDPKSTVTGGML